MLKVNSSSQQELPSCCFFENVFSNMNIISGDYCYASFVSLFFDLGHLRDFTSHILKGNPVYI